MKLSLSQPEADNPPWLGGNAADRLCEIAVTLGRSQHTVELIVVNDAFMRKINRRYRGSDRPTDVISFSYLDETDSGFVGDNLVGEIYVSYETLEKEAKAQGVEPENLFLQIGVHGLLHVLGYDHKTDRDTSAMVDREKRLLRDHLTATEVEELY